MSTPAPEISVSAQNFNWLVSQFTHDTGGVIATIVVSSDGLLIATSSVLEQANADRLAAISSAMLSLAQGTSECYPLGPPDKVVIELAEGFILMYKISAGCLVCILAAKHASLGTIAYETLLFAESAREVLTPRLIEELKSTVGIGY
jgi:predicted regulator of Ras-like GTPase activity (Roadblock/LC7/MglB family)